MKLSIIVNLEVPHSKSKWTRKERITLEDGVTTIRPLRNGVPGGTEKEVEASIAEYERAIRESNHATRKLMEGLVAEVDLPADIAKGWDANGSPV
jgi:hypothetical protein